MTALLLALYVLVLHGSLRRYRGRAGLRREWRGWWLGFLVYTAGLGGVAGTLIGAWTWWHDGYRASLGNTLALGLVVESVAISLVVAAAGYATALWAAPGDRGETV